MKMTIRGPHHGDKTTRPPTLSAPDESVIACEGGPDQAVWHVHLSGGQRVAVVPDAELAGAFGLELPSED